MKIVPLSGSWKFHKMGESEWLPAQVPGTVHTDLLELQRIPDPFVRDNEDKVKWVAESDWQYQRSFTVEPDLLEDEHVFLVCDGLDTLARLEINGQEVGSSQNMFVQRRWEVKSLVHPGENEISVDLKSPVQYVSARQEKRKLVGVAQAIPGAPYLRKSQSQFGWDWGPRLPTLGIWRDIRLEAGSIARFKDIHLRQQHLDGNVILSAHIELERWQPADLSVIMHITHPDGRVESLQEVITGSQVDLTLQVEIANPQLWWPNGYGQQPLYSIDFTLGANPPATVPLDTRRFKLGLRDIELRQQPDEWGKSFTFIINGEPVFIKGANWIPADSFPTRITHTKLEHLLHSATLANMNMLRVWGGGYYEDEYFYDLCDQLGLLVWQDFMFACSMYPFGDSEFLKEIQEEVDYNMRRLRHRTCIALWCGNNEMEQAWVEWGWGLMLWLRDLRSEYENFFHQTLPEWVARRDPDRPYWPSSPHSEEPFDNPNGQKVGDAHYWEVWHRRKPFTAFRQQYPRFMSEFGFQSMPTLPTVKTFTETQDWKLDSPVMLHHQRSAGGNALILTQMSHQFREPKDFPSLVYTSMILQAEGIRYGVEHWRRNRQRVSGILYWQHNDVWPAASWSSLDYFGRWKALHYYARRFYAPLLLSVEDDGLQMKIYITNDGLQPWEGHLQWSLETLDGSVIEAHQDTVNATPASTTQLLELDCEPRLSGGQKENIVLVTELLRDGQRLVLGVQPFVHDRHLALKDPGLETTVCMEGEDLAIDVRATRALARFVELTLEDAPAEAVFSDNYFSLPAGRAAHLTCRLPEGWSLEQARSALKVQSLYGTYK